MKSCIISGRLLASSPSNLCFLALQTNDCWRCIFKFCTFASREIVSSNLSGETLILQPMSENSTLGKTRCFTDNNTTTHQITKKETSVFFPVNSEFVCFCSPKHPFFQVTNEEVHVLVDKTAPCWAEFPTSPRSSGFVTTPSAFSNGKNLRKPHGSSGFQHLPGSPKKKNTRWKSHPPVFFTTQNSGL